MQIDQNLLHEFELFLDPQHLDQSKIMATVLGFGEISSIFQIGDDDSVAFKRLPLFENVATAQLYEHQYQEYCQSLRDAGLHLPDDTTAIIQSPRPTITLYIAQQQLPAAQFAHRLIHQLTLKEIEQLFERIVLEIKKVWEFNLAHKPVLELSLDGQLSNWVWYNDALYFVDTSTPMYRKNGMEQLDPDLLLQSAPAFLRWILRLFFLDNVMNRYYNRRQVYIDLAANLYKEQKPELIPCMLEIINRYLSDDTNQHLTIHEIEKYYREDRLIWTLFLSFRRVDRWITTKILSKRYEFILPGKIRR